MATVRRSRTPRLDASPLIGMPACTPKKIPPFYPAASLRNVTPWDAGRVGVGLEADDGSVIRFSLSTGDAAALARLLYAR